MRAAPFLLLLGFTACTCGGVSLVGTRASVASTPAEIDFGAIVVGSEKVSSVVLAVSGVGDVQVVAARFDGAAEFSTTFAPEPMESGSERSVAFRFAPAAEGTFEATWILETDATLTPEVRVMLKGQGVRPVCVDGDGDGYGTSCEPGPDCDDTRAGVHPGAAEACGNGLDDDCEPATSDVCPCVDADGDTYGDHCANGLDCDDANGAVHPGATEACGNGLDDDCNPATSDVCPPSCIDGDGDGYGENCAPGLDCDDDKPFVNPGQPERCGNVYDDDCNPATSDVCPCVDADGDTYGDHCANGPDCDDANGAVHPGAAEACGNGLDDDCDPATSDVCPPPCIDGDGDGYGENCAPGLDCDDYKPFINPGQPERCGNVYDDDCNPATRDDCPVACPPGGCGVGCADGEREAFVDTARYPAIAGCAGGFSAPGIFHERGPTCSRGAGDDSANPAGWGCDVTDLCAQGWHVCRHVGEVAAKSVDGCAEPDARGGLFFATRQSGPGCGECATGIDPAMQCGGYDCRTSCYPNDLTTNDIFGCGGGGIATWGTSCGVLSRFSNNQCSSLPAAWSCPGAFGADEALVVVKPGSEGGGVLCCAD